MGKFNLSNPRINRIAPTDQLTIVSGFNFNTNDALLGGGKAIFKLSDTEDFAFATTVNPTSFETDNGNGTWSTVNGNTISLANLSKTLRFKLPAFGSEKMQYVKLIYEEGAKSYESAPMIFTSLTEIYIQNTAPVDTGSTRPTSVLAKQIISIKGGSSHTLKVEACNNGFDAARVWEDMTTQFLAGEYFRFTNTVKESAKNWGIIVRVYIKKAAVTDEIEVSELEIGFL